MAILKLTIAAMLPVLLAVGFCGLELRSARFAAAPRRLRQTVIGVAYGLLAILSTEIGIPVDEAVLNVRNAAPLTAGLIFGGRAGVIAGLIGGIERWLAI
ncbi:MAG: LytS/YhcK type 5TM receptor domain-containing protein, partial [Eubacteriales bacterium]|nr:LytS/YhcK type 5TM receptor domain-containing protein [Eubacteriales bacterium]